MIIVIDTNKNKASCLSQSFINMGVPSCAISPDELPPLDVNFYTAVVITSPHTTSAAFLQDGRRPPLFAVDEGLPFDRTGFDAVLSGEGYTASVFKEIYDFCLPRGLTPPGKYVLGSIRADIELTSPTYGSDSLPFTKTEALMLRTLIRTSPCFVSSEHLTRHIYRPTRAPAIANARTHISIMNKKSRNAIGKSIIESEFNRGYRISSEKYQPILL